jgi:hypothetical protein
MSESPPGSEHAFIHMLTVFSVTAGMVGVCLMAIGLVKVVSHAKQIETLCDDFLAIDAMIFGVAAMLGFRGLQRFVGHQVPLSPRAMDWTFLIGLGLMILICGIFSWSLL